MLDLLIVGAGPYGISLAAHAAASGLSYALLGYPMHFWQHQMPQNMFIRTQPEVIALSDERDVFTLQRFSRETRTEITVPLPRPVFVDYAFWFAAKTGVEFTPELVVRLSAVSGGFQALTESGRAVRARHAVVATGLQHYAYIPDALAGIPGDLVSHTFRYTDFSPFAGRKVAVLGSGQSAWEAAALLHMCGSDVELIYRREAPNYSPGNGSGIELVQLAEAFYDLPLEDKLEKWASRSASIAAFLRPYVDGKVPETAQVTVEQAEPTCGGKLRLLLSNGAERELDHLIAATGYRIDLSRVPFLDRELLDAVERETHGGSGFPRLNAHFESSVPGLYFAGPLASHSHGPAFRFIAGLGKTCRRIIPHICRFVTECR
ncbi:NAD(P)-binding domain-containing protein [Paenibacillus hamazuiensis]|uniref:NAD(P)-binding domain-containing protein n=1 Tax=Paenibacillus hamazuiensis TaxID=2936508 RepID=UPI00200E1F09|nr:NAD(P)-binding domain-containing protein [Paenibacillus hamazuiensis]